MRLLHPVVALAALLLPVLPLAAEDADGGGADTAESAAPNQEYLEQKAELEGMITKRDMELFEMNFQPLTFDRVVLTTRTGQSAVFHYLTFRLRNEMADKTSTPLSKAKGYNDVLAAIQEQYAGLAHKVEDNGVKLQVEGVEGKEGTIVERQDSQIHQKKVSITVFGWDEHGSRITLLDDPPGSGPEQTFNFPDLGVTSWSAVATMVKDRIEEKEGRQLYSLDKIRSIELPPYDASVRDPQTGWAKGEVFGVAMFHRLDVYGNHFTFEVHGLSNKFRTHFPDTEPGKVENYIDARFYRREYVLHIDRSGDEFFRDLDPFTITKAGWEWVNTFQRLSQRRTIAYARFFLDNIANDKGAPNDAVESEFWKYYADVRAQHPNAGPKLPDLEQTVKSPAGDAGGASSPGQ